MKYKLKFGGPSLPPNTETWYNHINPDGTIINYRTVRHGEVIDEERVSDAASYIERGIATRVASDAAVTAKGE